MYIKLIAAQPDNWQATSIGKIFLPIFTHHFNRRCMCIIGSVIFHLVGPLPFAQTSTLVLITVPSVDKATGGERRVGERSYGHYIIQESESVILPPIRTFFLSIYTSLVSLSLFLSAGFNLIS